MLATSEIPHQIKPGNFSLAAKGIFPPSKNPAQPGQLPRELLLAECLDPPGNYWGRPPHACAASGLGDVLAGFMGGVPAEEFIRFVKLAEGRWKELVHSPVDIV